VAPQQVLFDAGKFGFVRHQSKVEAFKIVVRDVVHALIVDGAAEYSQNLKSVSWESTLPFPRLPKHLPRRNQLLHRGWWKAIFF
jgi:hypothetical protein